MVFKTGFADCIIQSNHNHAILALFNMENENIVSDDMHGVNVQTIHCMHEVPEQ